MAWPAQPRWGVQVVTRWYGGIHLGPDRFKIINNVARSLLDDEGYVKQKKGSKSTHKR
jgi:putative IMPACT (imprinted ancient) family translation regulator